MRRGSTLVRRCRRAVPATTAKYQNPHSLCPPPPSLTPPRPSPARGRRIEEVPYDPNTPFVFDGEETFLAVRAWTKGYDFYLPDRSLVTHLYIPSRSPLRPTFWCVPLRLLSRLQQACPARNIHQKLTAVSQCNGHSPNLRAGNTSGASGQRSSSSRCCG